ncbi:MAG: pirin family protein [Actinomycetota bacterium]
MQTTAASTTSSRGITAVVPARQATEGAGFQVYRPFPTDALDLLDPFLLLDEMAPGYQPPGSMVGAPDHPHRGFETVTYVLEGEVEHRDSAGNHGIIYQGDVQWMTAGDGIVHSEMPSERIQREGGRGHGLQLWVNLPSEHKRTRPRYQAISANDTPVVERDGVRVDVVAGELLGVNGPAHTHTPVTFARLRIEPGATARLPLPDGHAAALYSVAGAALIRERALGEHELVVFDRYGGDLVITVDDQMPPLDAFVLAGEPIGEPVARYGPFVMNTREEIIEAIEDFDAGRMGSIPASGVA